MLQSSTHQACFHFPSCCVARISLLVPSPPTAVHKHVSKACWVGVRWFTDFLWCTVVTGDMRVHMVASRNKHVFSLPRFIWYDVQLNLLKKWRFPHESSHDLSLQQDDVFNLWSAQSHFVGCYSLARQSALFKLEL